MNLRRLSKVREGVYSIFSFLYNKKEKYKGYKDLIKTNKLNSLLNLFSILIYNFTQNSIV